MFKKVEFFNTFQTHNLLIISCCCFCPAPLDMKIYSERKYFNKIKLNFIVHFNRNFIQKFNEIRIQAINTTPLGK